MCNGCAWASPETCRACKCRDKQSDASGGHKPHHKKTMLITWEDAKKAWAEKGYEAIKGSEATDADKADTGKVIIRWA